MQNQITNETTNTADNQASFTPGPWRLAKNSKDTVVGYRKGKDAYTFVVAETCGYQEEREANARLIACAPEMLEMLESIKTLIPMDTFYSDGNGGYTDESVYSKIENLIAKAKGGN